MHLYTFRALGTYTYTVKSINERLPDTCQIPAVCFSMPPFRSSYVSLAILRSRRFDSATFCGEYHVVVVGTHQNTLLKCS